MQFNPRQYEHRSLHKEAVANRVIREFEMQSIYQGPSYAAVDVMHKYDATIDEIAWVLMGDTVTKSNEVYAYIESVIKARGPLGQGQGLGGANKALNTQMQETMADMPQYTPGSGMEGGTSQGTAGGNMQSHQAAGHLQSAQPGLGQRFKNWATQRALPAVGRGMQHLGAATMGGLAAGPLGAMAGLGGSMAASHRAKKQGVDAYGNPLQQGEGLGQIAGDAAKAGVAGARNFAGQQAQNFQTGQGAMGKVGQAAGAVGNIGRGIASAVGNAWNQAGQTQQANLQQMDPNQARINQRMQAAQQQQQVAPEQQQVAAQPEMAQVDPSAVGQIAGQQGQQGQQVPQWQQQPGAMTGAQQSQQNMIQTSNDTYSSIESILKGW